jgi:hypothetical protein
LIIGALVGQVGLDGLILALGDPPSADLGTVELLFGTFLLTAPLTVGVAVFTGLWARESGPKHPIGVGIVAVLCLGGGAAVGNSLGGAVLSQENLPLIVYGAGGGPQGLARVIVNILGLYYLAYGPGLFVASLVLGFFLGRWAVLLLAEQSTPG